MLGGNSGGGGGRPQSANPWLCPALLMRLLLLLLQSTLLTFIDKVPDDKGAGAARRKLSSSPLLMFSPILLISSSIAKVASLHISSSSRARGDPAPASTVCETFDPRLSSPWWIDLLLLALSFKDEQATERTHVDRERAIVRKLRRLLNSRALPLDSHARIFNRRCRTEEVNATHLIRYLFNFVDGGWTTRTRHRKQ